MGPVYPQDLPEEFPADADQAVKDKYVAWATTEVEIGSAAEFTEGKATFTVPNAKFMKAGVGFKAPAVEPVTEN